MSDKNEERQQHFDNNTIHDLVVAGTLLKEHLLKLIDAGLETGSAMHEELDAVGQ